MNAFTKLHRNASAAMVQRNLLLSQPPSYFIGAFNGRLPSMPERLAWIEQQVALLLSWEIYCNEIYQVVVERNGSLIHLCIRRHDGQPCTDWGDRQQIKNEIIGPEYEAVELFPAESRLIDTTNEYHLWVNPNPGFRFPFGFTHNRCVIENQVLFGRESHAA